MHHDTSCSLTALESGVPSAFLKALKDGQLPSRQAVDGVPNTLVSCLTHGHRTRGHRGDAPPSTW